MEIITGRKIFKCEFCAKVSLNAGAIVQHEKFCRHNPKNKHICFECKNCTILTFIGKHRTIKDFECSFFHKRIFTYKKQKSHPNDLMPSTKDCPGFSEGNPNEIIEEKEVLFSDKNNLDVTLDYIYSEIERFKEQNEQS